MSKAIRISRSASDLLTSSTFQDQASLLSLRPPSRQTTMQAIHRSIRPSPFYRPLLHPCHQRSTPSFPAAVVGGRSFHTTTRTAWSRKDSQDKDSINRESTEYSKSGTDDQTANEADAAFDPNLTSPEAEEKKAGEGTAVNKPSISSRPPPPPLPSPHPFLVSSKEDTDPERGCPFA